MLDRINLLYLHIVCKQAVFIDYIDRCIYYIDIEHDPHAAVNLFGKSLKRQGIRVSQWNFNKHIV